MPLARILFMIEFDLSKAVQEIKKRKAKNVALQIPEGIKPRLPGLVEEIEKKTGANIISFVDPCFGACGIKDVASKELGMDMLVHFGHTQFVSKECLPTIYIPIEYKADKKAMALLATKLEDKLREKNIKKIVLCSTIQFKEHRTIVGKELGKKGFKVFEGAGKNVEKGQVLGCNYSGVKAVEGKADAIIFIGDGLFHPIGLSFAAKKPVFIAEPVQKEIREIGQEKDLFLRKRIAMIEKAKQAKSIAIWVCTKKGQQRMKLAMQLKKKFETKGKRAYIFTSNLLVPDYIAGINVEAIVSTACPRIAFDDSSLFRQPIINPAEAIVVLGEKKIEEYFFDELCELC